MSHDDTMRLLLQLEDSGGGLSMLNLFLVGGRRMAWWGWGLKAFPNAADLRLMMCRDGAVFH